MSESPRGNRIRKTGPDVTELSAYVPTDLAIEVNVRAARERRTKSAVVADALRSWLAPTAPAAR